MRSSADVMTHDALPTGVSKTDGGSETPTSMRKKMSRRSITHDVLPIQACKSDGTSDVPPLHQVNRLSKRIQSDSLLVAQGGRRPQVKPRRVKSLQECNMLDPVLEEETADIQHEITEATILQREPSAKGDNDDQPILKVGDWMFCGNMGGWKHGDHYLSNSSVSFGTATDLSCNSEKVVVAMKRVSKDSDEESVHMMQQECRILQQLGNSHPHILGMIDHVDLPSEIVLLTAFAPAGDLSHCVPSGNCLAECEARNLSQQLLSGLAYLQSSRIIHGDVKPQNIFLTLLKNAYLAQLADFGLSEQVPAGKTSVAVAGVRGSYGFMPPEMIEANEASFATDLFALGVMLFRILAAYDPFYPASQVRDPLEFDPMCWSPLSLEAKRILEQLLAPRAEDRGGAKELLESHPWLLADKDALIGEEQRDSAAPQPNAEICFHDVFTAQFLTGC